MEKLGQAGGLPRRKVLSPEKRGESGGRPHER
jgi:hypothetical protein